MGAWSIWHWVIVLLVVVLVFGSSKLGNLGGDLGRALRGFKKGMSDDEDKNSQLRADPPPPPPPPEPSAESTPDPARDRVER